MAWRFFWCNRGYSRGWWIEPGQQDGSKFRYPCGLQYNDSILMQPLVCWYCRYRLRAKVIWWQWQAISLNGNAMVKRRYPHLTTNIRRTLIQNAASWFICAPGGRKYHDSFRRLHLDGKRQTLNICDWWCPRWKALFSNALCNVKN